MSKIKTIRKKFLKFLKNQNLQVIVLVIVIIINTWLITNLFRPQDQGVFCLPENLELFEAAEGVPVTFGGLQARKIDGLLVESQATSSRPLAVIIENHFKAWPQSGLAEANLVYEFLTEGGITRFLAFYDPSSNVKKIGPVRSCRPYFLNVAEEFQALHAHVGGSPSCLDLLKRRRYDVYNLDEYSKTDYFWRSKSRFAPHNVYTSTELMNEYLKDKEIDLEYPFESWEYKDDSPTELSSAAKINIDFSTYTYNVTWQYDKKNNNYQRYVTGDPVYDTSGAGLRPKNIIIQRVKTRLLDSIGRLSQQLEGRGDAIVFMDGQVITGHWKKPDRNSRTRFYSETGEEIQFNRGQTWVEVVPTDRQVTYK